MTMPRKTKWEISIQALLDLGADLRAARARHRFTQRDLSEVIGVNPSTIHRVEHNNYCQMDAITAIMDWLDAECTGRWTA